MWYPDNTMEDRRKLLLGNRDDMRVEVESGVAVKAKKRGGPSHTPNLAGWLDLEHPHRP